MKKLLLPALIVAMGAGAAFAGNMMKFNETGYVYDEGQELCIADTKMCGEDETNPTCTWSVDGVTPLQRFVSPTECGKILHEILP